MFEWIFSSSILIALVLALRRALGGRISLRLRYCLWAVVLLRLLVPVNLFDSAMSVLNLPEKALERPAVREFQAVASAPIPVQSYESARAEVLKEFEAQGIELPRDPEGDSAFEQTVLDRRNTVTLTELLRGLWLAGMAATGTALVLCNLHFARRLRRSRILRGEICCLLPVYESALVPTPCLFGFFAPAIYLTPEVAENAEARGHVLAHELTHYRHLDHIWAVLRSLCLVLHWYNPLVWLAFRLSREDAELACDEGALEVLGEGHRAEYGKTLIRLTCGEGLSGGLVTATTMTGTKSSIARRLRALKKARKTTLLAMIALILAGALAIGCTFSGAPAETTPGGAAPEAAEQSLLDENGVIVYPGTLWNMTPGEVQEALGLQEEDCVIYAQETYADDSVVFMFRAYRQRFLGLPVTLDFEFHGYTREKIPGLTAVEVYFDEEGGIDRFNGIMVNDYNMPADKMTSGVRSATWESDVWLSALADPEYWPVYQAEQVRPDDRASRLFLYGNGTGGEEHLRFASELPHLMQLQRQWQREGTAPSAPEEPLAEGALTTEQIGRVNGAFEPLKIAEGGDVAEVNPIHPFFLTYYDDVRDIDLQAFLRYCTVGENADEEEFQLLRKLENFPFRDCESLADMPVPLHRYPAEEVSRLLRKYTGFELDDLYAPDLIEPDMAWKELYYLPETDSYYNTTSDAAFGTFLCTGGRIYDGGIVELYSDHAILTLRQEAGKYYIHSHRKIEPGTALTDEQVEQVRTAFAIVDGNGNLNPLASMVNQYYTSPEQIDLEALIAYFPADGEGTQEEYALFQAAYPDEFPEWPELQDCPLPMHRYHADTVDGVLRKYANIGLEDLESKTGYYLEKTGCYYNFTSDMGLRGFYCTGGTVYDDGVILYSDHSTLALKKLGEGYVIDYHLPLDIAG